mmetsp:Transcript_46136/g.128332  ORF Transcript_46136/g.128332 Transcript_46136/m.128332 type:complete len:235 (-) Transcript_46136:219-923(-)
MDVSIWPRARSKAVRPSSSPCNCFRSASMSDLTVSTSSFSTSVSACSCCSLLSCLLIRARYSRFFWSTTCRACPSASSSTLVFASVLWMFARKLSFNVRWLFTLARISAHEALASETLRSMSAFSVSNMSATFCNFLFLASSSWIRSWRSLALISSASSRLSICLFCSARTFTCSSFLIVSDLYSVALLTNASIWSRSDCSSAWSWKSFSSQLRICSCACARSSSASSSLPKII